MRADEAGNPTKASRTGQSGKICQQNECTAERYKRRTGEEWTEARRQGRERSRVRYSPRDDRSDRLTTGRNFRIDARITHNLDDDLKSRRELEEPRTVDGWR